VSSIVRRHVEEHAAVLAALEPVLPDIERVADRLCRAFEAGGHVYTFGNGGSAADAQHLAAELIGRYDRTRRPLPAVSLATDPSVMTCIANDFGADEVFSRQVGALARPDDVVVGFSTSGRSANVVAGLAAGRAARATTVLFGSADGGPAAVHADLAILVPSKTTARIQEMHLLALHLVSEIVDAWASGEAGGAPSERDTGAASSDGSQPIELPGPR
jgi:D-sedoheptulose 7-phosphate isomerase